MSEVSADTNKQFIIFWSSQAVSLIGSAVAGFAVPIWLYKQTNNFSSVALAFTIIAVAKISAGPIAGILTDRWPAKETLLVCEGAQLLLTLLLILAVTCSHPNLAAILVLLGLSALFETLRFPTLMSTVSRFASGSNLLKANGWISMTDSATDLVAPIASGFLLTYVSLSSIIAVDAISFLISFLFLLRLNLPNQQRPAEVKKKDHVSIFEQLRTSLKMIQQSPQVGRLLPLNLVLNFVIVGLYSIFSPMVLSGGHSIQLLSATMSTASAAQILVGLAITRFPAGSPLWAVFFANMIMGTFGLGVIGITQNSVMLIFGFAIFMAAITFSNSYSRSIFQASIPIEVQGQFFACKRSISQVLTPLAPLTFAFFADLARKSSGAPIQRLYLIGGGLVALATLLAFRDAIKQALTTVHNRSKTIRR